MLNVAVPSELVMKTAAIQDFKAVVKKPYNFVKQFSSSYKLENYIYPCPASQNLEFRKENAQRQEKKNSHFGCDANKKIHHSNFVVLRAKVLKNEVLFWKEAEYLMQPHYIRMPDNLHYGYLPFNLKQNSREVKLA